MSDTENPAATTALTDVLAGAEAAVLGETNPRDRARALVTVADRLDEGADELIPIAMSETGLAVGRLRGELRRATWQLRLFAEVIVDGAYLDARINEADPDYVTGPRPNARRVNAIGPVLVYSASNLPFAFSIAGGDTAAALAAGNPVIVKNHQGHPQLGRATARIVADALTGAGLPEGVFGLIETREDGMTALRDPRVRAGAFTESTSVGHALADIAASRPTPIPFYGELGSVNPVFVTEAALRENPGEIAQGYVTSVTGSAGQLCTKPGFLFAPSQAPLADVIVEAASKIEEHRALTPGITAGYARRREVITGRGDVTTLVSGSVRVEADRIGWATPTFVVTSSMQHGGPYPANTVDSTSVGTAAIGRLLRPVAFQNAPQSLLPPLRDDNPWHIPQRRSPKGLSSQWGSLTGRY